MNILPFVTALVLIFSLMAHLLFQERRMTQLQQWISSGFERLERGTQNAMENREFKAIKVKKAPVEKREKKGKKGTSRRFKTPPSERGRLEISGLFQEENKQLRKTVARLIRDLYGKPLGLGENMEYRLVDAFIEKDKRETLTDLFPAQLDLAELYYKMLRGTQTYEIGGEGYPPFDHFVKLDGKGKAFVFAYASLPVLKAFFGDKVTREIVEKEKEKMEEKGRFIPLSKKELIPLVKDQVNWGSEVSFSTKGLKSRRIHVTDQVTQMKRTEDVE